MPTISVVMPVYNAMPFLPIAVESILGQTYQDFEFLIYDDASTDGSSEYLDTLTDPRVIVVHCPKQGHTPLLNQGIAAARGELIARMDADDVAYPQRLEQQLAFLEAHPEVVACGCQANIIDQAGKWSAALDEWPNTAVLSRFALLGVPPLHHPCVIFRKSAFIAAGGYDETFGVGQDYDLWWRLADHGQIANLADVLMDYRVHGANVSHLRNREMTDNHRTTSRCGLLRTGLASNAEEAEGFFCCFRKLIGFKTAMPTAQQMNSFVAVFDKFAQSVNTAGQQPAGELAPLRQKLRWAASHRAAESRWNLAARWRWLRFGFRIDPEAMQPRRALGRATARLARALHMPPARSAELLTLGAGQGNT